MAIAVQNITKELEKTVSKTNELEKAARGASGAFGGISNSANEAKKSVQEALDEIQKLKEANRYKYEMTHSKQDISAPALGGGSSYMTRYHTGTEYVSKNSTDDYYAKEFDLKPDEVIRILKVGEAVIPKNENLRRIKESSNFEDNVINKTMKISKTSQTYSSNDNSNVIISIGDTIVQGNADENIIGKLNEYKKSIVSEVFSRINKHTNLSGFRSVKRYV